MTRQIRQLGIGLMVCFAILFLQLNRLTVLDATKLNDNPNNTREILRDFNKPRGTVTTADGVVIARSVAPPTTRFELQREYPEGPLFAPDHRVLQLHARQLRRGEDLQRRAGRAAPSTCRSRTSATCSSTRTASATSRSPCAPTCSASRPRALGDRQGSVVALDPRDGAHPRDGLLPDLRPQRAGRPRHRCRRRGAAGARRRSGEAPPRPQLPGALLPRLHLQGRHVHGRRSSPAPSPSTSRSYPVDHRVHAARSPTGPSGTSTATPAAATSSRSCGSPATARSPRWACDSGPRPMIDAAEAFGFNDRAADRPHRRRPGRSSPTDFTRNDPGAGPVRHRPERRVRHAAPDGAGGRRGGQRRRDHDAARPPRRPGHRRQRRRRLRPGRVAHGHGPGHRRPPARGHVRRRRAGARPPGSRSRASRSAARPAPPSSAPTRPGRTPGSSASPDPRARRRPSPSPCSSRAQPEVSSQTGGRVAAPIAQAVLQAYLRSGDAG